MASNMDRKKRILRESLQIICDNLIVDEPTIEKLQQKQALLTHDAQMIRSKKTNDYKAEELVRILVTKPVTAYDGFMDVLLETDKQELHGKILKLQEEAGYKRGKSFDCSLLGWRRVQMQNNAKIEGTRVLKLWWFLHVPI